MSTLEQRRRAFSLLLTKGLIRIGLDVPAGAEFDDRRRRRSLSLRRAADVGVDVSPAAADDEPGVPERGHVGRPRRRRRARDQRRTSSRRRATRRPGTPRARRRRTRSCGRSSTSRLGLFTAQARDDVARAVSSAARLRAAARGRWRASRSASASTIRSACCRRCPARAWRHRPDSIRACSRCSTRWRHAASPERQAIARGEAIFNTRQFVIDNVPG